MTSDLLPLIYVCWDSKGANATPVGDGTLAGLKAASERKAEIRAAKERAVAEAWKLGWLPVEPPEFSPLELPLADGSDPPHRKKCVESLLRACDAILVVGKKATREMRDEVERFEGTHLPRLSYSTHSGSTFPEKPRLAAPPWHSWWNGAERRKIEGWVCKTCRRFWGDDEHGERMARYCCARELPCDRCGRPKPKRDPWTLCAECKSKADLEKHGLRKTASWNGHMIFSDALDEWYHDLDDAIDKALGDFEEREGRKPSDAELAEEMEAMQLLLSEPAYGRPFEPIEHLRDQLPDDPDEDRIVGGLEEAAEALNKAIQELGPLSYEYTNVALDVADALKPRPAADGNQGAASRDSEAAPSVSDFSIAPGPALRFTREGCEDCHYDGPSRIRLCDKHLHDPPVEPDGPGESLSDIIRGSPGADEG